MKVQDYKSYVLAPCLDGRVSVIDPRFHASRPLHLADDLAKAKRWVSAYRDGAQWALQEMHNG